MKFLIVVDMQKDFIDGALGSERAQEIVKNVKRKVEGFDGTVIFTQDTHGEDYLQTHEGRNLPLAHCIKGSDGWKICDELAPLVKTVVEKPTFGSLELVEVIKNICPQPKVIEICGLCTDICVISNAMILKAAFCESEIIVYSSCCAGVSEESHKTALDAMKAVHIKIK